MSDQDLFHPISSGIRLDLPVSVVLRQRTIQRGRWSVPIWELEAVALGSHTKLAEGAGKLIRETDTEKSYSWTGWSITLYKDACERYWHALIGDKPLVYVVCREPFDDESALSTEPLLVSVDYDEATAFLETDDTVLSMPIPTDIYRHMEAFVLQHYKPKPFKKRKRKKWLDGEAQGDRR